jgi:predicted hotdog family 3-hydroxylacyl-ACP dehydratase
VTPPIPSLIPHAGAMCLLDAVERWDANSIRCRTRSHLLPDNPLRSAGRLAPVCGIEFALQAAAVHGALVGGAPQSPGWLASLRMTCLCDGRLDDPALGTLFAEAQREHGDAQGLLYAIRLTVCDGRTLLAGRAAIVLQRP